MPLRALNAPAKLSLLWVDMTSSGHAAVPAGVVEHFSVVMCPPGQAPGEAIEQVLPQAVCLEFDYPDRDSLVAAAQIKRLHPHLPMFVITVQHSEQLAVWVFRNRFNDFLVAPVAEAEFARLHALVCEITGLRGQQGSRALAPAPVTAPPEAKRTAREGRARLLPALYYVQEHYREKLESAEIAALCGLSPFRFSREFRQCFGLTFRDYVVRYRLKEAKRLLRNPKASITDVAFAVGFNDLSYFSRMFRRYFGSAPSAVVSQMPLRPAIAETADDLDASPTALMLRLPVVS